MVLELWYSDHCNEEGEFINFDSYMIPTEDLASLDEQEGVYAYQRLTTVLFYR